MPWPAVATAIRCRLGRSGRDHAGGRSGAVFRLIAPDSLRGGGEGGFDAQPCAGHRRRWRRLPISSRVCLGSAVPSRPLLG